MTYNHFFQYLGYIGFLFSWAVLFIFLPWYIFLSILITFSLGLLILAKVKRGTYFFIIFVPIMANYAGFYLQIPGVTTNKIIPIFSIIALISFLCLGIYRASKLPERILPKNPLTIPIVILMAYALFSLLESPILEYNVVVLSLLITNILVFFFTAALVDKEELHRRLVWCWIFSGIVIAMLTLISIPLHPEIVVKKYLMDKVYFMFYYNPNIKYRGYALGHPNFTSLTLNLAICITTGALLAERKRLRKLALLIALGLMIFADFLTMSKAGVGSFLIMGFFIIAFSSALRKNLARNIILFIISFLLLFALSLFYSEKAGPPRLLKVSGEGGKVVSLSERVKMWKDGLHEMKRQSRFISGLGPGGFDYYTKNPHTHNLYLSFYFDFGLIGIGFVFAAILIIIKLIRNVIKIIYTQQTYLQVMTLVLCGGLIAIGIHGLVDHYYNKHILWLYLALTISTLQLTRIESAQPVVKER